jgi:hypothetical protein
MLRESLVVRRRADLTEGRVPAPLFIEHLDMVEQLHSKRCVEADKPRLEWRGMLIAFVVVGLSGGLGCQGRDAKAVAVVREEFALLKPPAGMTPTDQRVGLGEMYAEGTQTYCVGDEKAGQVALDSVLRNAGWEAVSTSTTADATVWHYRKDQRLGALRLETQPQPCGRRFRIDVLQPL